MIIKNKEDEFYVLLSDFADLIAVCGIEFYHLVNDYTEPKAKIDHIKKIETDCDIKAHTLIRTLNNSFITPFDREDILSVTRVMDDIVDAIEEAANRFWLFDIVTINPYAIKMAQCIVDGTKALKVMFDNLKYVKKDHRFMEGVIRVNDIEDQCDVVFREAVHKLFKEEENPKELIKWKELYELLEQAMDACESAANISEGMVMKYV